MKLGVLTSSRADYGIYLPLLDRLKEDDFFQLEIIAFGTHLSKKHGFTIDNIVQHNYKTIHKISVDLRDDSAFGVSTSYGRTLLEFSNFWKSNNYNLVMCLGDRFEMSAAVQAGIPFEVKFAHIHGGETTLGAIDNIYRHQITLASKIHFASTKAYKSKIMALLDQDKNIFNVGALSLDGVNNFEPLPRKQFFNKYKIDDKPFILCTFHPETVTASKNERYAIEMYNALNKLSKSINIVITMPNADTFGSVFRKALTRLKEVNVETVYLIENFGKKNYFTAMTYCKMMIGNTSSGIIEAASFKKYVVNVGNRQEGRAQSKNIYNAQFSCNDIIDKTNQALNNDEFVGENVYFASGTSDAIIELLKSLND